jgi:SAM-dependent methyltransferase
MNNPELNQENFNFLFENANAARALGITYFTHLDQPISIWNYIRIANDLSEQIEPSDILDWGCGFGQMTYLLKTRGFSVTSFEIGETGKTGLPDLPVCRALNPIYSTHPTNLPFLDNTFDAVLGCGVLEHVDEFSEPGNEIKSLQEIARILRPDGKLFIYQLPQLYAWQEAVARKLKRGYCHPRRYTVKEITMILEQTGYSVERIRCVNLIPKNLTGLPEKLRVAYSRLSKLLIAFDGVLCKTPGLNLIAGALEITAQYKGKSA